MTVTLTVLTRSMRHAPFVYTPIGYKQYTPNPPFGQDPSLDATPAGRYTRLEMRDLYRCLEEYSPVMLHALGEVWQVALPETDRQAMVETLGEAMLQEGALAARLTALSEGARQAVGLLLRNGGEMPSHRVTTRFGAIRRFGALALQRERPWDAPDNALEELYYAGLVYRAYGEVAQFYGEIVLMPAQVVAGMPAMDDAAEISVESVAPPEPVRDAGDCLAEDLFALVAHLRRTTPFAPANGLGDLGWLDMKAADLERRLLGGLDPSRTALLRHLAVALGLVRVNAAGRVEPSLRARDWMRQSAGQRMRDLYVAWRDASDWHDLGWVPTLICEGGGWRDSAVIGRRNLVRYLLNWQPGQWYRLGDFLRLLQEQRPDYLRPDGDLHSWVIRDKASGGYLSGFEAWEAIEGALAAYLLRDPLHWLGAVRLGPEEGEHTLWSLGPHAIALLSGKADEGRNTSDVSLATVDEAMQVRIPTDGTLYDRYMLERFAEWQAQDARSATYAISVASVGRGVDAGVKIDQILAFLRRITADAVPESVQRELLAWGGHFGRAALERVVLLRTVDEATLNQIGRHGKLQRLLGDRLSKTSCTVPQANVEELVQRLQELGIWPAVRL